jgi:hypothetical protein
LYYGFGIDVDAYDAKTGGRTLGGRIALGSAASHVSLVVADR